MTRFDDATERPDIVLVPVAPDDLRDVDAVFDELRAFSKRVDGVPKKHHAAQAFATSLPPKHAPHKKYAFLAKAGGRTIGLLDMIADYPSTGTVFIGLLAISERFQKSGFGRALWCTAERFAREQLDAKTLRLAVIESNPVLGFWEKMGFRPTGEVKPYQGERRSSRAILMEKVIVRPED